MEVEVEAAREERRDSRSACVVCSSERKEVMA